ncbi:MAG TPA: ABC transporter permease [Vicinamibacterales bacterium]
MMKRFVRRWLSLFRSRRHDDELAREMDAHLALAEDEYRRRGMSAGDARQAARRAMGSMALARDRQRDARSFVWIDDLARDLRYALRNLRRSPGFTIVAVVALALGIGVNTTFFTIVNAICLRGLPIDEPDRVMYVSTRDAANRSGSLAYAEFDELRSRTKTLARVGAYTITVAALADNDQPPARVPGAYMSAGGFELLGDRPILGRTFRADEDRPGTPPVVILGEELWSNRYARDPNIIGRSVIVNGTPTTVIGVMPRGFQFPANADIWRPMANFPSIVRQSRSDRRLGVFARMAAGATATQARADIDAIGAEWRREWPVINRDIRLNVIPINEQVNPTVYQRGWIAFITAGVLVLLVACANVANLLLVRAASRGREMAIRSSIGASRSRVVRQWLVESATLSALAGAAGMFVAWGGLRALESIIPPETLPYWMTFTIDARVLMVTIAVCLGSVFVCGLPSALQVSKVDLRDVLAEAGVTASARPARRWITALLAAEFAITMVLVALAVFSMRNNRETRRSEFQIDPSSLMTMWVSLPVDPYGLPATRASFFERLDQRIGASPGIGAVAFSSELPYGGARQQPLSISGRALTDKAPDVSVVAASEQYFSVLRVPIVRGRAFTAQDGQPGSEAAIVNERFVRLFMPNENPIGARIRVGSSDGSWLQIVGVATTVRQQLIGPEPDPVVFLPFRASPSQIAAIVVRTTQDPLASVSVLRHEVEQLDRNLPLYRVMTFEQSVRYAVWNGRLSDTIVKSIAVVALLLALVGIYAVTGHAVQRWTRELGLRVALGAEARQIGWLVLKRVLTQLALGLGFGIAATLAFDRLFSDPATAAVSRVHMTDPVVMTLIILAIAAIAIVACFAPLRRAVNLDPVEALRTT